MIQDAISNLAGVRTGNARSTVGNNNMAGLTNGVTPGGRRRPLKTHMRRAERKKTQDIQTELGLDL